MISSDDRYFPIILTSWHGPFSKDSIDAYFERVREQAARAKREDVWMVSITADGDAPTSAERKHIAELTRAMPADLRDRTILSLAIVESPVKRGVLTAITWLMSDLTKIEAVRTHAEAIEGARRALASVGGRFPASLNADSLGRALAKLAAVPSASGG